MNRILSLFSFLVLVLTGCSTEYYLAVSDAEIPVYQIDTNLPMTIVPANKAFIYRGKSTRRNIRYGSYNGQSLYSNTWQRLAKLNKKQLKDLVFTTDKGFSYNGPSSSSDQSISRTRSSTSRTVGGPVAVKGYTRKNGTYVQPHTRSAPRRH